MFISNIKVPINTMEDNLCSDVLHTENKTYILENLNPDKLKYIFQTFPFLVNGKTYYFDKFVTIREAANGIELSFWYNITRLQKSLIFKMVDGAINTYQLKLIGIRIRYKVHPGLQEKFGVMHKERIFFKEPPSIWDFSPDKEKFKILLLNNSAETMEWIMKKEYFYSDDEYIATNIHTRLISSLIIGYK